MIGYYAHHLGHGHVHRALAVAEALRSQTGEAVTGLSTCPPPTGWTGDWVRLADDGSGPMPAGDPTAGERLHWVPVGHPGLRSRMARIAAWIDQAGPRAVVVDVSVEVALLTKLHGIPVVSVVVPGWRDDAAHALGFEVSDALVGCWPPEARGMLQGAPGRVAARVEAVGAVSRFPLAGGRVPPAGRRDVVVLSGSGGTGLTPSDLAEARQQASDWRWTVLDRRLGSWADDPLPALRSADVVVTHAGEASLAEVAAARCPAVVVPQPRPHAEQVVTAAVLAAGPWPARVEEQWPRHGWARRLERTAALPGEGWATWCDGLAADRIAGVVRRVALPERS